MTTKDRARLNLSRIRKSLNQKTIKDVEEKVLSKIINSSYFNKNKVIGIYMPVNNEVNLLKLIELNPEKTFCIPKVVNNSIIFVKIDKQSKLIKNKYGILEPISNKDLSSEITLCYVPLIGVNSGNYRLGYGGGYYDRFFNEYKNLIKIGIGYRFQLIKFLPETHDIAMDYVILE